MSPPSPLVSVVIATYNSGEYLRQAIESVLTQSVPDLELIVVDDGSTDETRSLVGTFKDSRLHYVWQQNAGQTVAKNRGVRESRGRFVAFCDGDDYWYPFKLEKQLPLFTDPGVAVVYSPIDTVDAKGASLDAEPTRLHDGRVVEQLFVENFVPFGTAMVRREVLAAVGGFDESLAMGIDWDLWLRISVDHRFAYAPVPTYAYRVWGGQMSKNWRGRYSCAFRIMSKFLHANPGVVSAAVRRRAYGSTYANRARARVREHTLPALLDGVRAVSIEPLNSYAWKTIGRVIVAGISRHRGRVLRMAA